MGDTFFDQLARSGHRDRLRADLRCFAELGIQTLRTGLLWERFEATRDWAPWDLLLSEMRRLHLTPIVGLLHHGSGPPWTDLLDPGFPEKLAAFALKVARRYPDVLDYTPVNEPQTTGRFSCLYGFWYPHQRSLQSYVRAVVNQARGIALSMQAIRSVQPAARLVHTEDGGVTYSTPPLESARIEREHRRWLGTDLLCGLVTRDHALFTLLRNSGLSEAEILWFSDNPCPPAVLGLNYYVTSDRFLDHRCELYPGRPGADAGAESFVDVEAVRVRPEGITGVASILREAWDRYRLPVAITEAHLGCEPVEQTRWLLEVWNHANEARNDGVDVRAVTVWALLGSYNWANLCTDDSGAYEAGVFDLSTGKPRPTPLADLVYRLAHDLPPLRSATQPGWWQLPERLTMIPPRESASLLEDSACCS